MTDKSGDNDELEALFDSIASSTQLEQNNSSPEQTEAEMMAAMMGELCGEEAAPTVHSDEDNKDARSKAMFTSIGQLTRQLHDTMRELGFDKSMEKLASELPDTRDRLSYVAKMTEQAAERVLNATDAAQPIQEKLSRDAKQLNQEWSHLLNKKLSPAEGGEQLKLLVHNTQSFLNRVESDSDATNRYLMEIVMAQDFQDLTGQVIKKVIAAANELEDRLVNLLIEYTPEEKREEVDLLHGPQVKTEGRNDIVTDQSQVDDLLASLGF